MNNCKITHFLMHVCMLHKDRKEPVKYERQSHYCEISKVTRLLLKVSQASQTMGQLDR